jgi:hypothetical protein
VDRNRFDADPDLTSHLKDDRDPDPEPDPNLSFKYVVKSEFFLLLFTAVPVYIVLSFSSAS